MKSSPGSESFMLGNVKTSGFFPYFVALAQVLFTGISMRLINNRRADLMFDSW